MEMFTYLHLMLLITGVWSYVCKHLGEQCRSEDYPYHVNLVQQLLDDPEQDFGIIDPFLICSGTLVHKQWILTTGHCYDETNFRKPLKVKFSASLERPLPNQIIPHNNIRKLSSDSGDESLMLVKLSEPVRENNNTAHLPASSCTRPEAGEILYSLNYPHRTYDSDKLQLYRVEQNITACDKRRNTSSKDFFCAEATTSVTPFLSCPSDTGGALLRTENSSDVVYGVKISGYQFMDVCAVRQLIYDTINDL